MDFKSASAGPGAIVIEQFGQLQLFDLASSRLTPINVTVSGAIGDHRDIARKIHSEILNLRRTREVAA